MLPYNIRTILLECLPVSLSPCGCNLNSLPIKVVNSNNFSTELPNGLGASNFRPTAVHEKPFLTSVSLLFSMIIATTTNICTKARSIQLYSYTSTQATRHPTLCSISTAKVLLRLLGKRDEFSGHFGSVGELLNTP